MRIGTVKIKSYEKGLVFLNGEFNGILDRGRHYFLNPFMRKKVQVVSQRQPWLVHEDLEVIVKSGALKNEATVIDLKDNERALVWIDGRFAKILTPGLYVLWKKYKDIRLERVDASEIRLRHAASDAIVKSVDTGKALDIITIHEGQIGLFFHRGEYIETLMPGRHLFWKDSGEIHVHLREVREQMFDLVGQDIITADKVTLRINAVISYCEIDPVKAFSASENTAQALYREGQLALRAVIGAYELDTILADKNTIIREMQGSLAEWAGQFGLKIMSMGIRDVILPGDMKALLNKVTEAKKASEANLIARREEVAALRSQANSAKMLEENPALMRLRELETLERVAEHANLSVVLGEKGLTQSITKLI